MYGDGGEGPDTKFSEAEKKIEDKSQKRISKKLFRFARQLTYT